jgi:hypothetical protein
VIAGFFLEKAAPGARTASLLAATPQLDSGPATLDLPASPAPPAWLASIQRRIRDSVAIDQRMRTEEGRWLSPEVADVASSFFREYAGSLPSEPHIYSSMQGHLVAEFLAGGGALTIIIATERIILFASIGDEPVQVNLELAEVTPPAVVQVLKNLTVKLRTVQHGSLDATS